MTRQMTGAKMVVQALKDQGVDTVFGYPGGAVLPIYDEVFPQNEIQHILVRHEQGATHAADGYARATGKPGVVLVTSGPGATNCVTGIATAYMDSSPLVVFTGQVSTHLIGNDAFQEVDCIGITRPCVKHNFLVERVEDLAPAQVLGPDHVLARRARPEVDHRIPQRRPARAAREPLVGGLGGQGLRGVEDLHVRVGRRGRRPCRGGKGGVFSGVSGSETSENKAGSCNLFPLRRLPEKADPLMPGLPHSYRSLMNRKGEVTISSVRR